MNETIAPRPDRMLLAATWFVLLESAVWFALGLAVFFDTSGTASPFAWIGGMMALPIAAVLFVTQYLAVFRRAKLFAEIAAAFLFIMGGINLFGVVSTLAESFQHDFHWEILVIIAILAIHGGIMILAGYLNFRWTRVLRKYPPIRIKLTDFRFTLQELFGAIFFVSLIAGITTALLRSS